jgi:hypothetical protein
MGVEWALIGYDASLLCFWFWEDGLLSTVPSAEARIRFLARVAAHGSTAPGTLRPKDD